MAGNTQYIYNNSILANGATAVVDIDRFNWNSPFLLLIAATGTLTVNIYDGFGPGDPVNASGGVPVVYNGTSVAIFTTTPTTYTVVGFQDILINAGRLVNQVPRWVRVQLINSSGGSVPFSVIGDF